MTEQEAHGQAFENGRKQGDAEGYARGLKNAVKHGQWVPLEYDGYADGGPVWDLWECSECREEHSGDEDTLTPYCPNCGARMDGDGDG